MLHFSISEMPHFVERPVFKPGRWIVFSIAIILFLSIFYIIPALIVRNPLTDILHGIGLILWGMICFALGTIFTCLLAFSKIECFHGNINILIFNPLLVFLPFLAWTYRSRPKILHRYLIAFSIPMLAALTINIFGILPQPNFAFIASGLLIQGSLLLRNYKYISRADIPDGGVIDIIQKL